MNKILALVVLTIFLIALMPGLKVSHHTTIAATTYDVVTIILNESKSIASFYYVSPNSLSYYGTTLTHSGIASIPNDTILFFQSGYPFMLNGHYAVEVGPDQYLQDILITHDTTIYIDFVQRVPKNASLIYPITLTANATAPSIITVTAENNNASFISPVFLTLIVVIAVAVVIIAGRKIKR
uniref:Uncharacterized protein n=1 Tax=Sulfolobus neozealandicus TaxID=299422 RepID=Q5DVE4_9CREN|nr:hypothetical protein [Sulfolobus neozealandicus]